MTINEKIFQKNCELWARFHPKQAVMLPYLDCSSLVFCETKKGELNLKKISGKKNQYFYSNTDIAREAKEWFSGLDLDNVLVVCVYGAGLGHYYDAAKTWLKKDASRRLVFLEDDLAVIHRLLETKKATGILQDHQVQVLYFKDLKDNEAVLEVLYWNFAMTRLVVSALKYYAKEKEKKFTELHHKIAHDSAVKNALVDEYLRFGGAFFINFYQNMLSLPGSFLGNKTFGSFRKVPAIICGAGPSLAKNIKQLPGLLDKALIFTGGSSLNALNAAGIQPHLGSGIDPNPAQFERLKSNQAFEVPFYYRNRLYHEAFEMIHGPRLYITGSGGYDIADWFEEKLHISHEFLDEGHNVINFCLQIAHQLGCDPIIFVGMDLAFTGMKSYAPGVEENIEFDPNKALDMYDFDERPLLLKDIYGKPLYTLWKWVAEAEWIGDFAKEHSSTTIINCTEGGLGFPDVPNKPLSEVAKDYLIRSYAIQDRLNGEIQNSVMRGVTLPKMIKITKELQVSLKRCIEHFTVLLEEAQNLREQILKEKKIPSALQSGRAALRETELAEEPGYQYVLDIFNAVQVRMLSRELHESKAGSEISQTVKKLELNIKRFGFLMDVAKVNVGLIDMTLEKRKLKKRKKVKPAATSADVPPMQEITIEDFNPILLPVKPQEAQKLEDGHIVRIQRQYGKPPEECRVEKDGVLDGQCHHYYPDGTLKQESFYKHGRIHGRSTFFSKKGAVLSKSYYKHGKQEGESRWFYLSGALYAIQRYHKGKLHGRQEYYYENGNPKTQMQYRNGKLEGKVFLYYPEGELKRVVDEVD